MTDTISILFVKLSNVLEKTSLIQWNGIEDDTDWHMCRVQYMQYLITCEQLACDQNSASFIQISLIHIQDLSVIPNSIKMRRKDKTIPVFFFSVAFFCLLFIHSNIFQISPPYLSTVPKLNGKHNSDYVYRHKIEIRKKNIIVIDLQLHCKCKKIICQNILVVGN